MNKPHTLANKNKDLFLETFKDIYEHSPWVCDRAYDETKNDNQYDELDNFCMLLAKEVKNSSIKLQDKLIKAHPMLALKKNKQKDLTDFSKNEQSKAGLSSCSDEELEVFEKLNKEYFDKFNFPFIIAVKNKNKEEILQNFQDRLKNDENDERNEALKQIDKIAKVRIKGIYEK